MSINMKKRVKAIKGYYTSLKYNDIRKETLEKISTLSKELKFKDSDDFSYRFSETASLIHKNWTVFMAVCDHVDVITTIIDYFNHFGVGSRLKDESAENDENETVMCIMLTIYNIYKEHAIQLFLETAIM
ncbi:unnamed protein product [Lasius platythorax]|uniref:Uncharacterized protein n=1 Tax=Lasius platythorax TaxID=488582 RepID=A0AAV2P7N7_9HYME